MPVALQGFRGEKGRAGPPGPDGKPVSAEILLQPSATVLCAHLWDPERTLALSQGKDGRAGEPGPAGSPGRKAGGK